MSKEINQVRGTIAQLRDAVEKRNRAFNPTPQFQSSASFHRSVVPQQPSPSSLFLHTTERILLDSESFFRNLIIADRMAFESCLERHKPSWSRYIMPSPSPTRETSASPYMRGEYVPSNFMFNPPPPQAPVVGYSQNERYASKEEALRSILDTVYREKAEAHYLLEAASTNVIIMNEMRLKISELEQTVKELQMEKHTTVPSENAVVTVTENVAKLRPPAIHVEHMSPHRYASPPMSPSPSHRCTIPIRKLPSLDNVCRRFDVGHPLGEVVLIVNILHGNFSLVEPTDFESVLVTVPGMNLRGVSLCFPNRNVLQVAVFVSDAIVHHEFRFATAEEAMRCYEMIYVMIPKSVSYTSEVLPARCRSGEMYLVHIDATNDDGPLISLGVCQNTEVQHKANGECRFRAAASMMSDVTCWFGTRRQLATLDVPMADLYFVIWNDGTTSLPPPTCFPSPTLHVGQVGECLDILCKERHVAVVSDVSTWNSDDTFVVRCRFMGTQLAFVVAMGDHLVYPSDMDMADAEVGVVVGIPGIPLYGFHEMSRGVHVRDCHRQYDLPLVTKLDHGYRLNFSALRPILGGFGKKPRPKMSLTIHSARLVQNASNRRFRNTVILSLDVPYVDTNVVSPASEVRDCPMWSSSDFPKLTFTVVDVSYLSNTWVVVRMFDTPEGVTLWGCGTFSMEPFLPQLNQEMTSVRVQTVSVTLSREGVVQGVLEIKWGLDVVPAAEE